MSPFSENPFAVMTLIVAPAVLTNASSVLSLGNGNRLARVVEATLASWSVRGGLAVGCALLVRETRLAVLDRAEERVVVRTRQENAGR